MRRGGLGRRAESDRAEQIGRTGAKPGFLRPAQHRGRERHSGANVKRADSRRCAELVTADRHQIASQIADPQRDTTGSLRRVDMKHRARACDRLGDRGHILNRADFRVGETQRHQRRIGVERRGHRRR